MPPNHEKSDRTGFCLHFLLGAVFGSAIGFGVWGRTEWARSESILPGMIFVGGGFLAGGLVAGFNQQSFWEGVGPALNRLQAMALIALTVVVLIFLALFFGRR